MINRIRSRDKLGGESQWPTVTVSKGKLTPNDECDIIVVAEKGYVDRIWLPQSDDNAEVLQPVPHVKLGDISAVFVVVSWCPPPTDMTQHDRA